MKIGGSKALNTDVIKSKNVKFLLFGIFFITLSSTLVGFFLPYFLKERGLTILDIGMLLTVGLAVGSLVVSVFFGKIQKRIKLSAGNSLAAGFNSLMTFILFVIPNTLGVILSTIFERFSTLVFNVSSNVTIQHNNSKNSEGKNAIRWSIYFSISVVLGLIISIFSINFLGFTYSLLLFVILSLPAIYYLSKINDGSRFKIKSGFKLPKVSRKLKVYLAAGVLYNFILSASFTLVITFLVTDLFSESYVWVGVLFIILFSVMGISAFITKKIIDKVNLIILSSIGMFFLFLSAVIVIFSTNIYWVLVAMIVEGIGAGIWTPSQSAYYWRHTPPSARESFTGYYQGITTFFKTLGPLAGGILVTFFGITGPFYFKAVIALLAIVMYFISMRMED